MFDALAEGDNDHLAGDAAAQLPLPVRCPFRLAAAPEDVAVEQIDERAVGGVEAVAGLELMSFV